MGIGTPSPSGKLEIVDPANHLNLKVADTISQSTISFSDNDGLAGMINYDHNTDKLHFITDGTHVPSNGALNITSAGNVGIGTTTPNAKLDIVNTSTTTSESYGLSVQGGGNSTDQGYSFRALGLDGSTDFFVRGDGNVGIGTTSPDAPLTVKGASLGSNAGARETLAQIQGSRHRLLFNEVRHESATAGVNWDGVTYKLQKKVDATEMQSINFVHNSGAGANDNHIDLYVGGHTSTDPIFSTRFAEMATLVLALRAPRQNFI